MGRRDWDKKTGKIKRGGRQGGKHPYDIRKLIWARKCCQNIDL